jgi:hypothetical protein
MKKSSVIISTLLVLSILLISVNLTNCKKTENPIKFPTGTFPDGLSNLNDINSSYDDYNVGLQQLNNSLIVVFSSNRESLGGKFNLVQGSITFTFNQTSGTFSLGSEMTNDQFLTKLINAANTTGNDFGPYRIYSATDGFEYLMLSSENARGDLDLYYLKNRPVFSSTLPEVIGPYPVKLLNSASNEAYICFDSNQDSLYFSSDAGGTFDIFLYKRPAGKNIDALFNLDYDTSFKVDSINSTSNDKCPFIYKNIMVFSSDRQGGMGGYDLYYSIFRKGKWNSPVNFGPSINTESDEYRPVINYDRDYTNMLLIFSSNRSGGKGGFDLYFKGVEFPK